LTSPPPAGGASVAEYSGEHPLRDVVRLALPVFVTMASQSMMGLADVFFMRWVGTTQQAAVGLGSVASWTFLSLFCGTLAGVSTFVAQELGAGRPGATGGYVWQSMWPVLPFAIPLTFAGPLVRQLLLWIGAEADVAALAARYCEIRLWGAAAAFAGFAVVSFFRGLGDMLLPMWVTLGQNVLNIALNALFVFGFGPIPPMGLEGVAWATVIATVAGTLVCFAAFLRRAHRTTHGALLDVRPDARKAWAFLRVGLPIGVSWVLEMVVWTVFTIYAATLGKVASAAHNIVMQIVHVSFMPGIAISIAAGTIVGRHLGAGRPDLAERYGWTSLRVCLAYMGGMGLLFFLLRDPLIGSFAASDAVWEVGRRVLVYGAIFQLFDAVGITCGGVLRGAGDTRYPMFVSIAGAWLFFLPLIFVFGTTLGWGIDGAWLGATAFLALIGVLLFDRFRRGKWKTMRVVDPAAAAAAGERG
jgi:MATE family multidrug resistance protein